jgi:hypothetical protein
MSARTETVPETDESASAERRSFLGLLMGLIVSSVSAVVGVAAARFAIIPAISSSKKDAAAWLALGTVAEIPEGKPVRRSLVVSQDAG